MHCIDPVEQRRHAASAHDAVGMDHRVLVRHRAAPVAGIDIGMGPPPDFGIGLKRADAARVVANYRQALDSYTYLER